MLRVWVRLQKARTIKGRLAFVRKEDLEHGIVKGSIGYYQVCGRNWTHVRRILRQNNVMGFTGVYPDNVQGWEEVPATGAEGLSMPVAYERVPEKYRWLKQAQVEMRLESEGEQRG